MDDSGWRPAIKLDFDWLKISDHYRLLIKICSCACLAKKNMWSLTIQRDHEKMWEMNWQGYFWKLISSHGQIEGDLLQQTISAIKSHICPSFFQLYVCAKDGSWRQCRRKCAIKLWKILIGLNVIMEVYGNPFTVRWPKEIIKILPFRLYLGTVQEFMSNLSFLL